MTLTTIDGIPLFSTLAEALQWAASNGLTGYHIHIYQGQTGYMGGYSHGSVISPTNTTTSSSATSSSSGGGGGY
jgi:hypothetical protein